MEWCAVLWSGIDVMQYYGVLCAGMWCYVLIQIVMEFMECYGVYDVLMWYYKELWNVIGCQGMLWGGL